MPENPVTTLFQIDTKSKIKKEKMSKGRDLFEIPELQTDFHVSQDEESDDDGGIEGQHILQLLVKVLLFYFKTIIHLFESFISFIIS